MATRIGPTRGTRIRHLRALAVFGAVVALLTIGTASGERQDRSAGRQGHPVV